MDPVSADRGRESEETDVAERAGEMGVLFATGAEVSGMRERKPSGSDVEDIL